MSKLSIDSGVTFVSYGDDMHIFLSKIDSFYKTSKMIIVSRPN